MRRPDFANWGIQGDALGVGYVVAELRGFTGADGARRDIEAADGKLGAAQLFDGEAIVFAALLGLAGFCLPLELLARFVSGEENVGNVKRHSKNCERRIKDWVL